MLKRNLPVNGARVLIMGLTFKENCPDLRNTRVIDIIDKLCDLHANVDVYDPWVDKDEALREYDFMPIDEPEPGKYDAIILAVPHRQFIAMGVGQIRCYGKPDHVLFDVKYMFPAEATDGRL